VKPNSVIFKYCGFINGSLLYAFEYFLVAWQENHSIEFIILDSDPIIQKVLEDRYEVPVEAWGSIKKYSRADILKSFNRWGTVLLVDYTSIEYLKGLINAKILVLSNTADRRIQGRYYSEMPFFYGEPYTIKFAFKFFKKIREVKAGPLSTYKTSGGYGFTPNFFETFSEYNYVHRRWDNQPRLILEAAYYGKKITYSNPNNIKDGSYYRYKDLKKHGLINRYLDSTDEIIKALSYDTRS